MIIDIRDKKKYLEGHIDNAINIPFNILFNNPDKYLKKDNKYYLYCQSGSSSKILVNYLNKLGYTCINIDGGYSKYLF